jgi:hypothetical protein
LELGEVIEVIQVEPEEMPLPEPEPVPQVAEPAEEPLPA